MANLETTQQTSKLKIKETVSHLVEIDKEVDLPYCFAGKQGYDYYKIVSPEIAIAVYDYPGSKVSIELRNSVNHFLSEDIIEINESSFNAAYHSVITKILNQNL